jgi:hypothetical protein
VHPGFNPHSLIQPSGRYIAANEALTERVVSMLMMQVVEVPEQSPPQLVNTEVAPGVSVSVTDVPEPQDAKHEIAGQSMPAGELVTDPAPFPCSDTDSGWNPPALAAVGAATSAATRTIGVRRSTVHFIDDPRLLPPRRRTQAARARRPYATC